MLLHLLSDSLLIWKEFPYRLTSSSSVSQHLRCSSCLASLTLIPSIFLHGPAVSPNQSPIHLLFLCLTFFHNIIFVWLSSPYILTLYLYILVPPWSLVHIINLSSVSPFSFSWPETWRGRQEEPVPAGVSGARAEAPPAPAGAAEGRQRCYSPEQPRRGGKDTHGQCRIHPLLRPLWLGPRWVRPQSLNRILI